jgi:hypothetical protein
MFKHILSIAILSVGVTCAAAQESSGYFILGNNSSYTYLFTVKAPDGSLTVAILPDGSAKFGDGITPQAAAERTMMDYNKKPLCGALDNLNDLSRSLDAAQNSGSVIKIAGINVIEALRIETEAILDIYRRPPLSYPIVVLIGVDANAKPPKSIEIAVNSNGTVEYKGFSPSPDEKEYFQILANGYSCKVH